MNADVRPLLYYGMPTPAQQEALRAGKALLAVDWFVKLREVKPGDLGHVLAFEPVPFIVDGYVRLTKPPTPERMATALREVFGITDGRYLIRPADQLSAWLGGEVRELTDGWEEL